MRIKSQLHVITLLLISLLVGCGPNVSVTGKVTFPDGTPLTSGEVVFQTDTMMSRGDIQEDGTYFMTTGENRGVPRGSYRVSIEGFGGPRMMMVAPADGMRGPQMRPVFTPSPIDSKFFRPETSGLTVDVSGRTVYNIEVTPP